MASSKLLCLTIFFQAILSSSAYAYSSLFREYIGAGGNEVTFSDVPINLDVEFHFILSFAIDYTTSYSSPNSTNGQFNVFWNTVNLNRTHIAAIKASHPNVRVAVSIGGASVGNNTLVYFQPSSVDSWVHNAVSSLTTIIHDYGLDGVDIDYEQFVADDDTFAECIGRLIATLKQNGTISFISIAPFDDERVQAHYIALWQKYGHLVDYVNFQFYAYANTTTVAQFLQYFEKQSTNYYGGKILVSFATDGVSGGLGPAAGFFDACDALRKDGKLQGIFIWSADDSKKDGFVLERRTQSLLANSSASCTHGCNGAGGIRAVLDDNLYFSPFFDFSRLAIKLYESFVICTWFRRRMLVVFF